MNPLIPILIGGAINSMEPSPDAPAEVPAATVLRSIPAEAKRAHMQPPAQTNVVQLGSKNLRLSPGAQIRSAQNLIVMPSQVQQPALVRYLVDGNGDVSRIWILSADEASRPDPK
jgi:hypothetical protein